MNLLNVVLMAPSKEGGGGYQGILMIVAIIVIFYFFMIRPQQQRAKKDRAAREALGKGAKVITAGGIHGKIVEVKETTFILEIANNVQVEVEKGSINAQASEMLKK